jgi:hypothetical protein
MLVSVGMLSGAASAPAQASDDVIVERCTDPALRQAIADAPAGATVRFACDGEIPLLDSSGPIDISKELTIDGSGREVAITGDGRTRLFFLSGNTTITMRDLTLRAGRVVGEPIGGGAVVVANTKLIADGVRFAGNYSDSRGGAIAVLGLVGALEVTDSEFVGNSIVCSNPDCFRGGGGAINVNAGGTTRIVSSTFRDNATAAVADGGSGGAVQGEFNFNAGLRGPIEIVDSVFEHNHASNLDLSANSPPGGGGAVAALNHPLTIEGSRFVGNGAASTQEITRGGAVNVGGLFDEPQTHQPVSILDSTFIGNRARGAGGFGGAVAVAFSPTEIARSTITGSDAQEGGALFGFGPTEVIDSRLTGNLARGDGGGIWSGGTVTVSGTDVVDNGPDGCFRFVSGGTELGEIVDAGDNFEAPAASCEFAPIDRPTLAIGDVSLHEPEPGETGRALFALSLSEPLIYPLRVAYATEDGSATAGQDYAATAGEVTIPAGAKGAQVAVDVFGGDGAEAEETFGLVLSLPEPGRTVLAAGGRPTATILPDGPPPIANPPAAAPIGEISVVQSKLTRRIEALVNCDQPCEATLDLFRGRRQLRSIVEPLPGGDAFESVGFELRRADRRDLRRAVRRKGSVTLQIYGQFSGPGGSSFDREKFELG